MSVATLDYYRIFYCVAECKSFTKAAELMNNSQPNITRCMNNLENELGVKLFERTHRGITLTRTGQRLYEHVAVALEQFDIGEAEIREEQNMTSGLISIGASEIALHMTLLPALQKFLEEYPKIRIRITNDPSPEAMQALDEGVVDFAVITTPFGLRRGMVSIPLVSFHEILLAGNAYRGKLNRVHSLKELAEHPFISLGSGTGTRDLFVQYFMNSGLTFTPDLEASTTDQILPMVEYGLGLGFYPEELARDAIREGKVFRVYTDEPSPERQVCLLLKKNRKLGTASEKLIAQMKAQSGEKRPPEEK